MGKVSARFLDKSFPIDYLGEKRLIVLLEQDRKITRF